MSANRITVDCVAAGQPRPYADSVYVYIVTFEEKPPFAPKRDEWLPREVSDEHRAILAVKATGMKFKTPDEKPEWHETRLTGVERQAGHIFRVSLIQEFTD